MEQVHEHVVRRPAKLLAHQRNPAHDFGELVHGHTDKIDLARNGTICGIVSVTESAAERERAIVGKIILSHAQGLSFRCAQHVKVT